MHLDLWHGTNQNFTEFSAEKRGLNTINHASRLAFFFAHNPETAREYARQASRTLIPDQDSHEAYVADLLARAETAMYSGNNALYDLLVGKAESAECSAIQADPSGARILHCRVSFENPLTFDGSDPDTIFDMRNTLISAVQAGHDAVIFDRITDCPTGNRTPDMHVAVFNSDQIVILDQMELSEEPSEMNVSPEI